MKVRITTLANDGSGKRMKARFYNSEGELTKTIKFGYRNPKTGKTGSTYPDHKNKEIMRNYIARHKVNEDWSSPYNAGALSRWVLWSKPDLEEGKRAYAKRYKLELIK